MAPSGEQIEIVGEGQRAVVVEVGGGLRSYSVDGVELLDGYPQTAMCTSGRGQLPYCADPTNVGAPPDAGYA